MSNDTEKRGEEKCTPRHHDAERLRLGECQDLENKKQLEAKTNDKVRKIRKGRKIMAIAKPLDISSEESEESDEEEFN